MKEKKWNLKVTILKLFFGFLFIANPLLVQGQEEKKVLSLSEQVQALNLDSTDIGVKLYYSQGYLERGIQISKQIENARLFYLDSLSIDARIRIALLDTTDYAKVSTGIPYGLPFVRNGFVMLPADNSIGAVKSMYAPFANTASQEIISNLNNAGFEYKDALNFMVDLIGLHELGHTQVYSYGLDTKQKWFNEFMASYFGYAYMQVEEPNMAIIWDNIMHAGFEGYVPNHQTLDEFNELYFGVGVGDYVWYQNAFQERIREVYSKNGLDFIRLVKEKLSDASFQPETADELLESLEEIEPGFVKWAKYLKKMNHR